MKRLTSILLSLILTLSLVVPAVAEELDPPLWEEYGCTSEEECIELWFDGDEAAYREEEAALLERQTWEKTVMADAIAAFDADDYWASGNCWQYDYYGSKEEFMEDWVLETEKDFYDCMLDQWLEDEWYLYWDAQAVERTRTELGGVAGQIGVMVDGDYVRFPDQTPELVSGRTMVPCRQVLEAFGGQVRYENGQAVCELEGTTLRFQAGSDVATMTQDGVDTTIQMDVPCYYKNGRTYIPVRFFAEALGCDVLWDSKYDTAVILRRDKVISELDSQFTVLNRLLAAAAVDTDQNTKTVVRLDGQVTMLDSINGDKTYDLDADMTILGSGSVMDVTAKMDLSGLGGLLTSLTGMSALEAAQMQKLLKDMELELIYDGEAGAMYLKMTGISELSYGMYDDDSWIVLEAPALEDLGTAGVTSLGAVLYGSQMMYAEYGTPVLLYGDLQEAAEELARYMGDGCFERAGGYDVLSYDKEDYMAQLTAEYGPSYALWNSEFEKLDLELKIARSGSTAFRVLIQNKDQGYNEVYLVDASGSVSATRVEMKMLLKLKNMLNLSLRYTATVSASRQAPRTEPPAGETVIDSYAEPEEDFWSSLD